MAKSSEPNSSIRVLHVVRRYDTVGGVERYVQDLARCHRERGLGVDVLTVDTRKGLTVRTRQEVGGRAYLTPELLTYQSAALSVRFLDTLVRLASDYDVLHFHYPNPIGDLSYLLATPLIRVPIIVTFHAEVVPRKSFSRLYNRLARPFLRRADKIVTTSANMLKTARILRGLEHKTKVIPLGIQPPSHVQAPGKEYFPDGVSPRLLYVGRLSGYKGVPYLLEAMANSPGHLVVVGDGPLRSYLEGRRKELGLVHTVTFAGAVPDSEVLYLYKLADILILPSTDRAEGFGYVLLEAMAASTALISTELGTGTSYANADGETGLVVPPADAPALSDALWRLASDRDLLQRYKKSALHRFRDNFTIDKMVEAVESEYFSLVEKSHSQKS